MKNIFRACTAHKKNHQENSGNAIVVFNVSLETDFEMHFANAIYQWRVYGGAF